MGSPRETDGSPRTGSVREEFMAAFQSGPIAGVSPQIAEKVTSEHIGKIFDNEDRHSERVLDDRKDGRKHLTIVTSLVLTFVLASIALFVFTGNAELSASLIRDMMIFGAGGLGGFGYGHFRRG